MDEVINTSKPLIQPNSKQETTFVKEVTSIFKNLDTSNITDKVYFKNSQPPQFTYRPSLEQKCKTIKINKTFQTVVEQRV